MKQRSLKVFCTLTFTAFAVTRPLAAVGEPFSQSSIKSTIRERLWGNAGEIYKPPLPNPGFIDAEQKRIAETMKPRLADLIEFYDPGSKPSIDLVPVRYQLKNWTADEKADITRIVARLLEIAPGLLINAASGERLLLCRNSSGKGFVSATSGNSRHNAAAVAFPGAIVISDKFFTTSFQFHGLIHEMVHESDTTGRFCYSTEWIDFINQNISDARIRFANSSIYEVGSIKEELSRKGVVPTAYACESVVEALAELVASTIAGSFSCGDKFKLVTKKFLIPNQNNLKVDLQYKIGNEYLEKRQYCQAEAILSKLAKEAPELASVHVRYGAALSFLKKDLASLNELQKADELFGHCGVPGTDSVVGTCNQYLISCYHNLHRDKACVEALSGLLNRQPLTGLLLYERFYSYRRLKNFLDAPSDLYFCCFGNDYELVLRDADANVVLMQKCLDDSVAKFPNFSQSLLRRAHFWQWLGERDLDRVLRDDFYQKALSDYQVVVNNKSASSPEAALSASYLLIKMGRIDEAEKLVLIWKESARDAMETKLMNIQLLAAKGLIQEADGELDLFWVNYSSKFANKLPFDYTARSRNKSE